MGEICFFRGAGLLPMRLGGQHFCTRAHQSIRPLLPSNLAATLESPGGPPHWRAGGMVPHLLEGVLSVAICQRMLLHRWRLRASICSDDQHRHFDKCLAHVRLILRRSSMLFFRALRTITCRSAMRQRTAMREALRGRLARVVAEARPMEATLRLGERRRSPPARASKDAPGLSGVSFALSMCVCVL